MSTLILLALALPGVLLILGLLLNASPGLPRFADDRGSIDNFIPEVWSARILMALRKALVYGGGNVVNRDYEGEIANAGDTVHINSVGDPTIFEYDKNTDMPAPETLSDEQRSLVITESPGFNFQVDDIDARQTQGNVMSAAMQNAGFRLRDRADQFIAGHYTEATSHADLGNDTTPLDVGTPGEAYELLVLLGVILDTRDVPDEGRFAVIPPWFHGLLQQDDRFVGHGTDANRSTLENGLIGAAAGFSLSKSNNVPVGAEGDPEENSKVIAGYSGAMSYAEQIPADTTEAYRPERRFGDAVKGLHLYGGKLVRPDGWAVASARDDT